MLEDLFINCIKTIEKEYDDNVSFNPYLIDDFVSNIGGDDFDILDILDNSSVFYHIDSENDYNVIEYCIPIESFANPTMLSNLIFDVNSIDETLGVFPSYVFDFLNEEKVKIYLTDYKQLLDSSMFTSEENDKMETIKVVPISCSEINTCFMEAIADSIDVKFGMFTETDYFNKLYEDNQMRVQEFAKEELDYDIDNPLKFLTYALYSYYTCDEYFCCTFDKIYDYVKEIDINLRNSYYKKENKESVKKYVNKN